MMLLDAAKSFLLLIDMQERLLPAMANGDEVLRRCSILLKVAKRLEVPVVATEQYPKGLGHTVPPLRAEIGNAPVFEKTAFSAWRDANLKKHLVALHDGGRPQAIVAGVEAHVCVAQTAIDLAQAGFAVFAVADAMTSRAPSSVALAEERMRQDGVAVINTEMAVFELLGRAGTAEFKELSALIR
jgi:nicotinamidase-related amidase